MPTPAERMAVNAAIDNLIQGRGDWLQEASVVIEYGSKLKVKGYTLTIRHNKNKDSTSGYSPGVGNVTIEDEKELRKESIFGGRKERVGQYRTWKDNEGVICFHGFWKSEITTRSLDEEGPDEFHLGYDPSTLMPKYFAVLRATSYKWWSIEFQKYYLELIYGTGPLPRQPPGLILG